LRRFSPDKLSRRAGLLPLVCCGLILETEPSRFQFVFDKFFALQQSLHSTFVARDCSTDALYVGCFSFAQKCDELFLQSFLRNFEVPSN